MLQQKKPNDLIPSDIIKQAKIIEQDAIIYQAHLNEIPIGKYTFEDQDNKIFDLLMQWHIFSGIARGNHPVDYNIIFQFIKRNYPKLNATDIDLAINMSTANKLQYKKTDESFGVFSCAFVGRILSAYSAIKPEIIHDTRIKIEKQLQLINKSEPDDKEKLKIFKEHVKTQWKKVTESDEILDWSNTIFDYLYYNELVSIDKDLQIKSREYAKLKMKVSKVSKPKSGLTTAIESLNKIENRKPEKKEENSKSEFLGFQKEYVTIQYLKGIGSIEKFLKDITIETIKYTAK